MKVTENKSKSITIRVTAEDYAYLLALSKMTGTLSISEMVRQNLQSMINAVKINVQAGKINLDDFKTI